ncbi:MAG: ATP-binding protein [bacterium]
MDTNEELKITLNELNPWWDNTDYRYDVIPRSSFKNLITNNSKIIDVFIGARRVGKTSIMKNIINHLLNSGINRHNIVYFVTDARVSKQVVPEDIVNFVRANFNVASKETVYLFLDEVQDMPDWQRGIKYLYDNSNIKIYITGSSSLILRSETSKLTGRFILHEVLGLSFKEYLEFTNQKLFKQQLKNTELVTEYLQTGGYPEYVLTKDKQALSNIIESTLYRDLISQYGIRNPSFLKDLLDYLADKVTNPVSNQNIAKDLKVNDDTARFYLKYLQDVYLIYPLYRKSKSNRISKSSVPKYYFNDTGVLNLRSLSPKIGLLAENAVYLKLRRKSFSKEYSDIFYNEINGVEVDFDNRQNELIEVKFRDNIAKEDIVKYQSVESKISFIVKNQSDILSDTLPMHSKITLDKYLLK